MIYQYVKSPLQLKVTKRKTKRQFFLPFIFMGIGAGILVWAFWPIVSFALFIAPNITATVSPVAALQQRPVIVSPETGGIAPVVLAASGNTTGVDYTNPNIWFPTFPQKKVVSPVNTYTLSIPKLKILDARVVIASDDLNSNLIHYGGTGIPGEYGTAVIFGHSVLPQFFNPANYKTIFSTLLSLVRGDDILITYDGITYRYQVEELVVTEPNDLSSLEQKFDDSYLTLITCVPPGTYLKRLNVKAKLIKLPTG